MSKINQKEVREIIEESRKSGKTDQQIYYELTRLGYDKKQIALLITGTATDENRARFKTLNTTLLVLLGITVLFKLLSVLGLTVETGEPMAMLLVFIVPLLNIYFMYEVAHYRAPVYRLIVILSVVSVLSAIMRGGDIWDIIISVILGGAIAFLAFYLDKNMFPKFRPRKMPTDSNGEYVLN